MVASWAGMASFLRRAAQSAAVIVTLIAGAGGARAQTAPDVRSVRILDVGLRPLVSFPDALGVTLEIHPFGGHLTLEAGAGMSPVVAVTWTAALKYRFPIYTSEDLTLSIGPGVGMHWLFERGAPTDEKFVSAFGSIELVSWHGRIGFRLAMDAGVAHAFYDAPGGANLGTVP